MSFQIATECKTPHLRLAQAGRWSRSLRLDGSGTPRECVLRVHPLHQLFVSGANLAPSCSPYLRAECPSSLRWRRHRPARTSSRPPGRSPAVACDRVGNGGMLSSRRNEVRVRVISVILQTTNRAADARLDGSTHRDGRCPHDCTDSERETSGRDSQSNDFI